MAVGQRGFGTLLSVSIEGFSVMWKEGSTSVSALPSVPEQVPAHLGECTQALYNPASIQDGLLFVSLPLVCGKEVVCYRC